MLTVQFRPHRSSLKAGTSDEQKLFAMLKLMPNADVASARPPLAFALVIDTSGSMLEFANQEMAASIIQRGGVSVHQHSSADCSGPAVNLQLPTKLDQAIEAAHALIDDIRLTTEDQVTVIHFDDDAKCLHRLSPLGDKRAAHHAADSLRQYSGGTQIARGLKCAEREFTALPPQVAKRVLLLTDGQTFDEPECRPLAGRFAEGNTPLIALGVGVEYNEDLLRDLAEISQGRPYHLAQISDMRDVLAEEVGATVREVVTDLQATVSVVKGVKLTGCTRVYPSLSEITGTASPVRLGNIPSGDFTVFILEFTISEIQRPPSRVRIAQIGLSGHVPGLGRREELAPIDLFVAFTTDEAAIAEVDAEVLGYVQQKNIDRLVQEAVHTAGSDATSARKTLQAAVGMTQKIGNPAMTRILQNALDELNKTGTISVGTRKTVALGGRTKTVKTGATVPMEGMPSNEDIRKLTGA